MPKANQVRQAIEEQTGQPAEATSSLSLIEARVRESMALEEQYKALEDQYAEIGQARQDAEQAVIAGWDAIYDLLVELKAEYFRTPGFDKSKLKALLRSIEV